MNKEKIDDWAYEHVPDFLYAFPSRIRDFLYRVKYLFQRIFRKSHTSNCDIWNLNYHLAKIILPKIKAFKNANRIGYPNAFSEYHENEWKNRNEYDKAVEDGRILGGGTEKWEEVLDEIIFAFEFFMADNSEKERKKFIEKYGIDWHEKKPENRHKNICYKNTENGNVMIVKEGDGVPEGPWMRDKNCFLEREFYFDREMFKNAMERSQKGFELFGKYFTNLWD